MITPDNVGWVVFGLVGGPLTLLILVELLAGRVWWHWGHAVRRQDSPGEYWLDVSLQVVVLAVFAWYLLLKPAE